jgi:hypothetical protein
MCSDMIILILTSLIHCILLYIDLFLGREYILMNSDGEDLEFYQTVFYPWLVELLENSDFINF